MNPRAFIADDHPTMRIGLRAALEMDGIDVVGEAAGFDDALAAIAELKPDVVVTDFGMAGTQVGDGETYLGTLKQTFPDTPVVVVTMLNRPVKLRAILAHGVAGLVDKSEPLSEFVVAVRKALTGRQYLSESFRALLDEAASDTDTESTSVLSPRENDLLHLLRDGHTLTQVAAQWGVALSTVGTQKRAMMRKLQLASNADLADYISHLPPTP